MLPASRHALFNTDITGYLMMTSCKRKPQIGHMLLSATVSVHVRTSMSAAFVWVSDICLDASALQDQIGLESNN